MSVKREDVAELVMKIFDQLEKEYPGASVEDAVLAVELSDPDDTVELEDGREVPATTVLLESTTDRVTIQEGILRFTLRYLFGEAEE